MQYEASLRQEPLNLPSNPVQLALAVVEHPEVVRVANVSPHSELFLDEVVQWIEEDVGEELAGQIANRQSSGAEEGKEVVAGEESVRKLGAQDVLSAIEDRLHQGQRASTANHPAHGPEQQFVVDRGKEPNDVRAQAESVASCKLVRPANGLVSSLSPSARIGVVDESTLEERLECTDERVVDHSVAKGRSGDEPSLRFVDEKRAICSGPIPCREKFLFEVD